MKKILSVIALTIASTSAFAANNAAAPLTPGLRVALTDCELLADDVVVSMSNGVIGSYNCVTAVPNRGVTVATCHTAGRTATRTERIPCSTAQTPPDGVPACSGAQAIEDGFNTQTAEGASIFVGRTSGGAIGPAELDGSECGTDTVAAKAAP